MLDKRVRVGIACALLMVAAASAAAQPAGSTAKLMVTVVDESGGVLPGATVRISGPGRAAQTSATPATTSSTGEAAFESLAPGSYTLEVAFPGFETLTARDLRVRAGDNRRTLTLRLERLAQEVTVARDAQSASLDPGGLAFSTVLTREMIEALPDDPEEMAAVLEAMAPPGSRIRVDGFSGGSLPHKAQIKSVRLPRMDAMAAQNHGGEQGFLFIDIKTQPGAGPIRGSVDLTYYDDAFGANNPFTPVKGNEQTRQYGTFLAGSIVPNKASFSLNVGGTSQYTSPNLLAVLPDGTTLAEPLRRPTEIVNAGIRLDYALNPDHSLRASFDRNSRNVRNQGVGGFNLADRAFRTTSTTNVVRLAEGGPLGKRLYTESRLQLSFVTTDSSAALEAPALRVIDAFTSGGAQVSGGQTRFELEAASDLDYVRGAHSWRIGASVEGGRYRSDDTSNYLGTYTFSSLAAFNAGKPSTYTRRVGDPNITYSAWQTGVYVQDDWRAARSVLISAGVRAGIQTLVSDQVNVSPRLTVGWAPFRNGRLTLRVSYGYLYDWIDGSLYKQTQLVDGFRLRDISVVNPSYPVAPSSGSALSTNQYLWTDHLTLPSSHRLTAGGDRQITATMRVSAAYTWATGIGLLRGRNRNPPVGGVRQDPAFANVVELVSDAASRVNSVNLGWNLTRPSWKRSFFSINYTWSSAETNTTGAFALPASGDNLATEWGPLQAAHTASAAVSVSPMERLNLNLTARGNSGGPYNITTGRDDNLDGLFNDRPAGVSRNSARMAAQWDVNGRVAYAWTFGPIAPGRNPAVKPVGRLRMDASLVFQNLLNRANYVGYSGVMTSPFFGKPTNVVAPRRVQLAVKFGF